jgi:murein DD-endopeptidase MepM/ murein hydrolase activator NlpD
VIGSGGFVWPANAHYLSGNNYWSGHLGIDIAAGLGDPVYAADGGVTVFAGWSNWGYGNMVVIDHGNGWQTLYAHLRDTGVLSKCGESVVQGQLIGWAGSTGNSSGPHLHFELNFKGTRPNPWSYLPPP